MLEEYKSSYTHSNAEHDVFVGSSYNQIFAAGIVTEFAGIISRLQIMRIPITNHNHSAVYIANGITLAVIN